MRKYTVFPVALVLSAALLTGCSTRDMGNTDTSTPTGMTDNVMPTTETTRATTAPTTEATIMTTEATLSPTTESEVTTQQDTTSPSDTTDEIIGRTRKIPGMR